MMYAFMQLDDGTEVVHSEADWQHKQRNVISRFHQVVGKRNIGLSSKRRWRSYSAFDVRL